MLTHVLAYFWHEVKVFERITDSGQVSLMLFILPFEVIEIYENAAQTEEIDYRQQDKDQNEYCH